MVTNVMRFMTNCYIQLIETARQEAGFIVCKQQSCTVLKSWGSHGLNPTLSRLLNCLYCPHSETLSAPGTTWSVSVQWVSTRSFSTRCNAFTPNKECLAYQQSKRPEISWNVCERLSRWVTGWRGVQLELTPTWLYIGFKRRKMTAFSSWEVNCLLQLNKL